MREGGVVRPMLKLLFLMAKFEKPEADEAAFSLVLLRYYLTQDLVCYQKVKTASKLSEASTHEEEKTAKKLVPPFCYNLLDIAFRGIPEKQAKHTAISETLMSKTGSGSSPGFLEGRKRGKSGSATIAKDSNLFENFGFCFFYLLANLTQLLHFEILGIWRYQEIPAKEERAKKLKEFRKVYESKLPAKIQQLISLIGELLRYDYFLPTAGEDLHKPLLAGLQGLISLCKARNPTFLLHKSGISLGSVYSSLDTGLNGSKLSDIFESLACSWKGADGNKGKETDDMRYLHDSMDTFSLSMRTYLTTLLGLADATKESPQKFSDQLVLLLLGINCIEKIQPYLLFLTTHNFCLIDALISGVVSEKQREAELRTASTAFRMAGAGSEKDAEARFWAGELEQKVQEKFSVIPIPKLKMGMERMLLWSVFIERDEWREEAEELAGSQYRKLRREQANEMEVWFDKEKHREHLQLYAYISSRYEKLLNKCALHRHIKACGRAFSGSFNEFVKLDLSRDKQGRAIKMKKFDLPGVVEKSDSVREKEGFVLTYGYLRGFYLKKLMAVGLVAKHKDVETLLYEKGFLRSDFVHKIVCRVFSVSKDPSLAVAALLGLNADPRHSNKALNKHEMSIPEMELSSAGDTMSATSNSPSMNGSTGENNASLLAPTQFDECVPKSMMNHPKDE